MLLAPLFVGGATLLPHGERTGGGGHARRAVAGSADTTAARRRPGRRPRRRHLRIAARARWTAVPARKPSGAVDAVGAADGSSRTRPPTLAYRGRRRGACLDGTGWRRGCAPADLQPWTRKRVRSDGIRDDRRRGRQSRGGAFGRGGGRDSCPLAARR